jgi:hypothetical protein
VARITPLKPELAELKANLPQIKHDAIMAATEVTDYCATNDLTSRQKHPHKQGSNQNE